MTTNDFEPQDADPAPEPMHNPTDAEPRRGLRSAAGAIWSRLAGRRFQRTSLVVAAVAAVIASAYIVGSPPDNTMHTDALRVTQPADQAFSSNGGVPVAGVPVPVPAATAGPAMPGAGAIKSDQGNVATGGQEALAAPGDTTQIVKTGQLSLEVADLDKAVAQAKAVVAGLDGYVSASNQSGTEDNAMATVTYRLPVAHWDDALASLSKVGSKTLSSQTDSTDVTSQVIDLNARLGNLKTTEAALQAIMAKAVAIPDVIAVESQLSDTQGQIEQLTAQRDHLKDQAAMSTLTVTFSLPGKTVTTQATQDWTLSKQVDEAAAALVRIGQGLATIGVWALIVVLPIGFAILVLLGLLALTRRIMGRGSRRNAADPA